jgi:hypothetical protein
VLDVDVDPLSGKVVVTQTDAITIFDGLAIDSKPTVNTGSSERGKLWGALRTEQTGANAYVTAPTTDQRQVNEMVRGLASDLPKGPDLGKAKAWIRFNGSGTVAINSSYNIKSLTDDAAGKYTVDFGIPFKSGTYAVSGFSNDSTFVSFNGTAALAYECSVVCRGDGGSVSDSTQITLAFFGELENE